MFGASRGSMDGDRYFAVKAVLFVVGASLGIAGMVFEVGWLVWAAIAVLAVAVIFRMMGRRRYE